MFDSDGKLAERRHYLTKFSKALPLQKAIINISLTSLYRLYK